MVAKRKTVSRKRSRPITPKKIIPTPNIKIIGIIIIIFIIIITATYLFLGSDSENDNSIIDENPIAVFDTSMGVFKVELYQDKMPITCNNFIKLANDEFYDGMIFYRISDDFMIQAGRFFADGSEVFSKYGNIDFEESDLKHVDGAISMASTGVKVGGSSEFFICDGEQAFLDGNYAAFGVTIEGLDVVRNIASQPHDNSSPAGGGKPYTDITINSITFE
jgi:cyclophilin family peptidyl-prolyl cis-trans isomerase